MVQRSWFNANRTHTICIDSYDDDILQGRFYTPNQEMNTFSSLTQFLVKMESAIDELQAPQAYTAPRKFFPSSAPECDKQDNQSFRKGELATFDLQILFRQHTSWQGSIRWQDQNLETNFRSVLELILLIDSALKNN